MSTYPYPLGRWKCNEMYFPVGLEKMNQPASLCRGVCVLLELLRPWMMGWGLFYFFIFYFRPTCQRQTQEAVDHLTSFMSGREEISQPGFEPLISSLRFGYSEDVNMLPIGVRITTVLTDYICPKASHTLLQTNTSTQETLVVLKNTIPMGLVIIITLFKFITLFSGTDNI
jgi:hypothetical protein